MPTLDDFPEWNPEPNSGSDIPPPPDTAANPCPPNRIKGSPPPELKDLSVEDFMVGYPKDFLRHLSRYRQELIDKGMDDTDPLRPYTSQLPRHLQDWLIENDPQRYFDGLPPFVIDFYTSAAREAARVGRLDELGDPVIELFLKHRGRLTSNPS